jgi:uncharacterized protein YdhG (YjbR/CyaY superfamily)
LKELRALIKKHGPELKEEIKYGCLSYGFNGGGFELNAQKNSVNFYVGTAKKIDPDGILLAGLDVGKGCIRFKKTVAVSETRIEEFIKKAMGMLRKGEDFGCWRSCDKGPSTLPALAAQKMTEQPTFGAVACWFARMSGGSVYAGKRDFDMTQLLDQAFRELAKLPASEQDALAAALLSELASEKRWAELFDRSQDLLGKLADEALAEHGAGKTRPM